MRDSQLQRLISLLDLTSLSATDTPDHIRELCAKGLEPLAQFPDVHVAGICVYSALVPVAHELLAGTPVRLASVAGGFPAGQASLAVKAFESGEAVAHGADEIDLAINRGAALSGNLAAVYAEIVSVRQAIGEATLKVIFETGEILPDRQLLSELATIAIDAGADFLKTSTGMIPAGATEEGTFILATAARAADRRVGVKPSGGIGSIAMATRLLELAESILGPLDARSFRLGASGLLDRLIEAAGGQESEAGSGH